MAHTHSLGDRDKRFVIDPITREIENLSGKIVLSQHDHNSEIFTFEIPYTIEGHGMSQCNRVQIHYLNIEAKKDGLTYEGVYEADGLKMAVSSNPDVESKVLLEWPVSGNATQYEGSLHFSIHFACVADDGTVEYYWSTGIHSSVSIGSTVYNSEVIALEYADVLEKWRNETFAMVEETLADFTETGVGDGSITPVKLDRPYLSLGKRASIASGDDLNDYTTVGSYGSGDYTITNSLDNCPVKGVVFGLDVAKTYGGTTTEKPASGAYYITHTLRLTSGTIWVRGGSQTSTSISWSPWIRILNTNDVCSPVIRLNSSTPSREISSADVGAMVTTSTTNTTYTVSLTAANETDIPNGFEISVVMYYGTAIQIKTPTGPYFLNESLGTASNAGKTYSITQRGSTVVLKKMFTLSGTSYWLIVGNVEVVS